MHATCDIIYVQLQNKITYSTLFITQLSLGKVCSGKRSSEMPALEGWLPLLIGVVNKAEIPSHHLHRIHIVT